MEIIAFTGWTWEYVGQNMTLPRLAVMQDYWKVNPPMHRLCKVIAASLGVKFETKEVPKFDNAEIFGLLNAAKAAGHGSITI